MIEFIVFFIFAWIVSFLIHELGHALEAIRQGNSKVRIYVSRKPPFLYTSPSIIKNDKLFLLAGGLFAGVVMLITGLLAVINGCTIFGIPALITAIVNLIYAVFETLFIRELSEGVYNIARFGLYVFLVAVSIVTLYVYGII